MIHKKQEKISLYLLLIYKFIIYAEIMGICGSTLWFLAENCKIKAIWNARIFKAFINITLFCWKSEVLPVNRTTLNGLKWGKSFKYYRTRHYYFSSVKQQGTQRLSLFAQQCSHNPQLFSVLSQSVPRKATCLMTLQYRGAWLAPTHTAQTHLLLATDPTCCILNTNTPPPAPNQATNPSAPHSTYVKLKGEGRSHRTQALPTLP